MRRAFGLIFATLLWCGVAQAQPIGQFDVEGRFAEQIYRGTVEIRRAGDVYAVRWRVEGITFDGVGMWLGDAFIVGYRGGTDVGVIVYRRASDGIWDGVWAPVGAERTGTERIVPRRP